ncbi:MAG: DUF3793 family protein [Clostridiales Family XIII bacterium]|nr:DUF3793 family protein [Clostridiales Family XIII bacterium]
MKEQRWKSVLVHSAPTIWGLRPANIFTLKKEERTDFEEELPELERLLRAKCVLLRKIHESETAIQIMVYRPAALSAQLRKKGCGAMLRQCGYPAVPDDGDDMDAILQTLSERMKAQNGFPHEIGLLLGYPPEDVRGFVRHKGKNYKYNGYWKVYGDLEGCKRCFAAYDDCREHAARLLRQQDDAAKRTALEEWEYEQNSGNLLERNREHGKNGERGMGRAASGGR